MSNAKSSEPIGISLSCQSYPNIGIPKPPNLIFTFGHSDKSEIFFFQISLTSSFILEYLPT